MTTMQHPPCSLGFSLDDLSAWRDHQLTAAETARARDHINQCALCQERLNDLSEIAQALRSHQPPTLLHSATQAQLWRGVVRAHTMRTEKKEITPMSPRTIIRASMALVTAALVIALAVTIARFNIGAPSHPGTSSSVPATSSPDGKSIISAAQAWGANAIISVSMADLGVTNFAPSDITPDGRYIAGKAVQNNEVIVAVIDLKMKTMHPVWVPDINKNEDATRSSVVTDGHYVVYTQLASDDTLRHLAAFDSQTQQTSFLAKQGAENVTLLALNKGRLIWQGVHSTSGSVADTSPLLETDITTGATTTLLPSYANTGFTTFGWPNFVYQMADATGQPAGSQHALNVETRQDVVLPQVLGEELLFSNGGKIYTVSGGFSQGQDAGTYYELTPTGQGALQWHAVTTISVNSTTNLTYLANDRLILYQDSFRAGDTVEHVIAWDRQLRARVDLGQSYPLGDSPDPASSAILVGMRMIANGSWFVFTTSANGKPVLNVIDTSHLPTH